MSVALYVKQTASIGNTTYRTECWVEIG